MTHSRIQIAPERLYAARFLSEIDLRDNITASEIYVSRNDTKHLLQRHDILPRTVEADQGINSESNRRRWAGIRQGSPLHFRGTECAPGFPICGGGVPDEDSHLCRWRI